MIDLLIVIETWLPIAPIQERRDDNPAIDNAKVELGRAMEVFGLAQKVLIDHILEQFAYPAKQRR